MAAGDGAVWAAGCPRAAPEHRRAAAAQAARGLPALSRPRRPRRTRASSFASSRSAPARCGCSATRSIGALWRLDARTGELQATIALPFPPRSAVVRRRAASGSPTRCTTGSSRSTCAPSGCCAPIAVGRGAAGVATADGAVWVANSARRHACRASTRARAAWSRRSTSAAGPSEIDAGRGASVGDLACALGARRAVLLAAARWRRPRAAASGGPCGSASSWTASAPSARSRTRSWRARSCRWSSAGRAARPARPSDGVDAVRRGRPARRARARLQRVWRVQHAHAGRPPARRGRARRRRRRPAAVRGGRDRAARARPPLSRRRVRRGGQRPARGDARAARAPTCTASRRTTARASPASATYAYRELGWRRVALVPRRLGRGLGGRGRVRARVLRPRRPRRRPRSTSSGPPRRRRSPSVPPRADGVAVLGSAVSSPDLLAALARPRARGRSSSAPMSSATRTSSAASRPRGRGRGLSCAPARASPRPRLPARLREGLSERAAGEPRDALVMGYRNAVGGRARCLRPRRRRPLRRAPPAARALGRLTRRCSACPSGWTTTARPWSRRASCASAHGGRAVPRCRGPHDRRRRPVDRRALAPGEQPSSAGGPAGRATPPPWAPLGARSST